MEGKELAKQTPAEKFCAAMKEYAESQFPDKSVVVMDYSAVLYVEYFEHGEPDNDYLFLTSNRSSWHALRGIVQALADHVYRLRKR